MISTWRKAVFDDLVRLKRGYDLPSQDVIDGEYPVVASSNIKDYHNQFKIKPPTVVTGRSGTLGKVQYIKELCWPLNTTLYAVSFRDNYPQYVYYFLQQMHLENYNSGAGVPTLNQNHLQKLEIEIPSVLSQKKISAILVTYDDLISIKKKRVQVIQNIIEELYKEWFVRFRFPEWKAAKFEKGVPAEWAECELSKLCKEIRKGVKLANLDESKKYLGLEHLSRKDICIYEHDTTDSVDSDKLEFEHSDILFGKIRPYLHKVCLANFEGVCSTDIIVLRPIESNHMLYILFTVFSEAFIDLANVSSKGTKMPRADWDFLKKTKLSLPPFELLEKFNEICNPLIEQMFYILEQIDLLEESKNNLIPRLMSGKLSVDDLDIQYPPSMQTSDEAEEK